MEFHVPFATKIVTGLLFLIGGLALMVSVGPAMQGSKQARKVCLVSVVAIAPMAVTLITAVPLNLWWQVLAGMPLLGVFVRARWLSPRGRAR
jgi:hypothetical protein